MMVTKKSKETEEEKGRLKIKNLKLNKETVKELTGGQKKQLRGGVRQNKTDDTCFVVACSISCI